MRARDVTAVILAGGRGRRFGGADKGLLKWQGRAMYRHQVDALAPQVAEVVLNANRNSDLYAESGLRVFADALEDFQGPLAGVHAALLQIQTAWLVTAPCDAPHVARDYVARMQRAAREKQTQLAVASDGARRQPVYLLVHQSLRDNLAAFLKSGERKIDKWFLQLPFAEADFSDRAMMFANANTRDEWERMREEAAR